MFLRYNLFMDLLDITLVSDRLKLVSTSDQYAEDIFREFTPEIATFMTPKPAEKLADTLAFISSSREKMKQGEELQTAILNKDSGEFIGHGGVRGVNTDTPELGIWIKKGAHGHKYGREAVETLKKWVDQNIKYQYIKYPVDRRNISSRKIAEYLGGVVHEEYSKQSQSGTLLDEVEYWIYPVGK
jgi:[ribosomal protein S5]-alanine N-acetyltransferase